MDQITNIADIQDSLEKLKTGTTNVAMVIKDGVVLATESQATAGFTIATKKAQKLFSINKYCGATIAGGVADCQYVVSQAQAISRLELLRFEKIPDVEWVANVIRNLLFRGRSFFYAFMIIGGYDLKENRGRLFPVDFIGYMTDTEDYVSIGSGSNFSLGVLEANWKPNMTKEEGIALAKQALTASRARDAGSGYDEQIIVITKDGTEVIAGPLKTQI
jgi:proteasome beta subunit